ncbi:fez family zinc finger protein erm [Caerostris extrusa]|uniref:Fez family zinc finger protein erm n=1 Tax=Caerostris extrusa TaxID=172846 RepID=A0AAV4VQB5_CAEEX|nr:fez family zinc finger protein erm [Caerostris extrusa]
MAASPPSLLSPSSPSSSDGSPVKNPHKDEEISKTPKEKHSLALQQKDVFDQSSHGESSSRLSSWKGNGRYGTNGFQLHPRSAKVSADERGRHVRVGSQAPGRKFCGYTGFEVPFEQFLSFLPFLQQRSQDLLRHYSFMYATLPPQHLVRNNADASWEEVPPSASLHGMDPSNIHKIIRPQPVFATNPGSRPIEEIIETEPLNNTSQTMNPVNARFVSDPKNTSESSGDGTSPIRQKRNPISRRHLHAPSVGRYSTPTIT